MEVDNEKQYSNYCKKKRAVITYLVTDQVILITIASNGSIIFRLVGLSVSLAHGKTKLNFLFFIVKLAVIRRNITINMKIPIEVTVFCPKFIMISILDGVYIESMYIDGESVTSAGR